MARRHKSFQRICLTDDPAIATEIATVLGGLFPKSVYAAMIDRIDLIRITGEEQPCEGHEKRRCQPWVPRRPRDDHGSKSKSDSGFSNNTLCDHMSLDRVSCDDLSYGRGFESSNQHHIFQYVTALF